MNDAAHPEPLPEALHHALGDVDVPAAARQSAVAAALAVFDEIHGNAPVIDLHQRRRRSNRWLTAAAAAVVIVGGAVAVRSLTGDSNDRSNSAIESRDARTAEPSVANQAAPAAATESVQSTAAADSSANSAGSASSQADAAAGQAPSTMMAVASANSPAELSELYRQLRGQSSQDAVPLACLPADGVVGVAMIQYQGQDAVLVEAGSTIQAWAATGCQVLATANP